MSLTEILVADFPPERVYHSLLEYLTHQKGVKVKRCPEPSHIEVELTRPVGCAKIEVTPRDEGSSVEFNFDFTKPAFTKPGFYWVRLTLYARLAFPILFIVFVLWSFLTGIIMSALKIALICLALGVILITEARLKRERNEFNEKVTIFLRELEPTPTKLNKSDLKQEVVAQGREASPAENFTGEVLQEVRYKTAQHIIKPSQGIDWARGNPPQHIFIIFATYKKPLSLPSAYTHA